jgi:hypothetical protein
MKPWTSFGRAATVGTALGFVCALASACRAVAPTNTPEARCISACASRAAKVCSADACERGCTFIIDRLVQNESDKVVQCVAEFQSGVGPKTDQTFAKRAMREGGKLDLCSDYVWAACAARIGPYLDGGPPALPPPQDIPE